MRAKIEWTRGRGRSYQGGGVEERFYCERVWENGIRDKGCLVRRIWWNGGEKGVAHWFDWETEEGLPILVKEK